MTRFERTKILLTKTFGNWSEDNVPRLAAAFSFYAMLSLAPVLVLSVSVAALILKGDAEKALLDKVQEFVGSKESVDLLRGIISSAQNKSTGAIATLISLLVTFFSASNLFLQLQEAANAIWDVRQTGSVIRNLIVTRVLAFLAVAVFGVLILSWLALDSWLNWLSSHTPGFQGSSIISPLVTSLFFTLALGVAYKAMPRGRVQWRDVWPGAATAAVGLALSKLAFSIYLGHAGLSAYGAAGSLVALLLWIYYSSQIFFFGLEITYTYTKEFGSLKGQSPGDLQYS